MDFIVEPVVLNRVIRVLYIEVFLYLDCPYKRFLA